MAGKKILACLAFVAFLEVYGASPVHSFTRQEEERIIKQLDELQKGQRDLAERVARIEGRLDGMDKRLDGMDKRIEGVERELDRWVGLMFAVLGLIGVLMGFTFWFARRDIGKGQELEKEVGTLRGRLDKVEVELMHLRSSRA